MVDARLRTIRIDPPIGVKVFHAEPPVLEGVETYEGVSFCDAVRLADGGEGFLIRPGAIEVCQWSPVVLGFKRPGNYFETGIEGGLGYPVLGVYVAPVFGFHRSIRPDVVLIRTGPEDMERIIGLLGRERFAVEQMDELDKSALAVFSDRAPEHKKRAVKLTNEALANLNRHEWFRKLTHKVFKSVLVSYAFDGIIKRYMADMSMCRNATATPYLTGKGNVSYFCTGGIAWGRNDPGKLVMGLPLKLFRRAWPFLEYPGVRRGDPRLRGLSPAARGVNQGVTSCSGAG